MMGAEATSTLGRPKRLRHWRRTSFEVVVLVMETTATQRSEILSGCLPAGAGPTSFTAEVAAAAAAGLRAVYDLTTMETDGVLVTDSLSLVDALRGDPYRISPDTIAAFDALTEVARKAHSINLVWLSSDCGVALNDKADRLARNGTQCVQAQVQLPVRAAKASIRSATAYPRPLLNTSKFRSPPSRHETTILN